MHIPKTGGTSIWKSLLDVGTHVDYECHAGADAMVRRYGIKRWNKYFKFAFVRNPWDRMLSCYFYDKMINSKNITKYPQFEQYLTYRLVKQPQERNGYFFYRMLDRIEYEGKISVNFIGQYEKLQEDFDKACDIIGIPRRKLGFERKTKHNNYREYYNKKTVDLVAKYFPKEIKMFNYEY